MTTKFKKLYDLKFLWPAQITVCIHDSRSANFNNHYGPCFAIVFFYLYTIIVELLFIYCVLFNINLKKFIYSKCLQYNTTGTIITHSQKIDF
jgi:hypothetical protein